MIPQEPEVIMNKRLFTDILFLIFAALWGITFPLTSLVLEYIDAFTLVAIRFAISALAISLVMFKHGFTLKKEFLLATLVLGVLNSSIYIFETLSLEYISPSFSAFLIGSNIIFMPFLAYILTVSKKISFTDCLASFVGIIGLYFLVNLDGLTLKLGLGVIFALLGALSIALSIIYVQHISRKKYNEFKITFYQLLFTVPIPLAISSQIKTSAINFNTTLLFIILFIAIFATALPLLGQIKYQHFTTPVQTALIFSLEPVFATIFSCVFFNNQITMNIIVGGLLMLISATIPSVVELLYSRRRLS